MSDASKVRCRRFRLTPDRVVLGLLVAECLLWLSDRMGWPAWHKGCAVLAGLGLIGMSMLGLVLWFAIAIIFRGWFQFHIRTLLVMALAVAVPFSWLAMQLKEAREQQMALREIDALGESLYEFDFDDVQPPWPSWLRELVGTDFMADVRYVELASEDTVDDALLQRLKCFSKLQSLVLNCVQVTDAGWKLIGAMRQLQTLELVDTEVTEAEIDRLRKSLPGCSIEQWESVAVIGGDPTIRRVVALLKTRGIDIRGGAYSVVCGVQVRKSRVDEAIRLLRADAKEARYWIKFNTD